MHVLCVRGKHELRIYVNLVLFFLLYTFGSHFFRIFMKVRCKMARIFLFAVKKVHYIRIFKQKQRDKRKKSLAFHMVAAKLEKADTK